MFYISRMTIVSLCEILEMLCIADTDLWIEKRAPITGQLISSSVSGTHPSSTTLLKSIFFTWLSSLHFRIYIWFNHTVLTGCTPLEQSQSNCKDFSLHKSHPLHRGFNYLCPPGTAICLCLSLFMVVLCVCISQL